MMTPLDYARAAVETMMRRFAGADLPPKGHFHYHQGVFLSGVHETWKLCGDERYFQYIKDWVDAVIDEDGNIRDHHHGELDDIQPGILLFPLWDRTGNARYEKGLRSVYEEIGNVPRNPEGGYGHKPHLPRQMWLDGLYMGGPFSAEYGLRFHLPELQESVVFQALMMEKKTKDDRTGLLYHAWDGAKEEPWADPETGKSPEFWGRALGWVPVALLNDVDFLEDSVPGKAELIRMATDLLRALCVYQSADGRWYQVVDKGDQEGNWLENSCSCLYVAALCKAMRKGYLPPSFGENARRGYEGVIRSLEWKEQDLLIGHVCVGTGVGDYPHYIHRPTSVNDLHGVGAFLLMCAEMQRWLNGQNA